MGCVLANANHRRSEQNIHLWKGRPNLWAEMRWGQGPHLDLSRAHVHVGGASGSFDCFRISSGESSDAIFVQSFTKSSALRESLISATAKN